MNKLYSLGPDGTFSMVAAERFRKEEDVEIVSLPSIDEVFLKISTELGSYGIIPIENTIAGIVGVHQDLIIKFHQSHNLSIIHEVDTKVTFGLLASGADLKSINFIYAHPHAYEQCQLYKLKYLPQAQLKYTKNTVSAAVNFMEKAKSEAVAAIVPLPYIEQHPELESFYQSRELKLGIQDASTNITRFFVVQCNKEKLLPDFSKAKTSIFIETLQDEPALLYKILSPFAFLKLNLTFLHSRAGSKIPWIYNFFIDFQNNHGKPEDTKLIIDILKRFSMIKTYVIGSYNSLLNQ